eukprot:m.31679 g.31679  ORF g.31679 m.31679 type:complete len:311 (-) comp8337_c0_seq2:86-1018(-)
MGKRLCEAGQLWRCACEWKRVLANSIWEMVQSVEFVRSPNCVSCSWAVYWSACAAKYPATEWEANCGTIPWEDEYIKNICHMWRYGDDLRPVWTTDSANKGLDGHGGGGVQDVIEYASSFWASSWRGVTGPGAVNDPDFLVVGCPTDGKCEPYNMKTNKNAAKGPGEEGLSDLEQRTQFSFWCLWGAPLIIGSDIRNLTTMALATLSNKEAIRINQDPAVGAPRVLQHTHSGPQIWARSLENGDEALIMYNGGDVMLEGIGIEVETLFGSTQSKVTVRDIWSNKTVQESFLITASDVKPHEARMFRVTPN